MAESTLRIEDRGSAETTSLESIFAEVLADVLRVDRVSVDSHFFDELGADSLVMAHFCARVRKRGNLPSVSMKDGLRAFDDQKPGSGGRGRRAQLCQVDGRRSARA